MSDNQMYVDIDTQTETTDQETMIGCLIRSIRGIQVILDRDLAELYGVETKVLNQAVRRNLTRFPEDFMFQLTKEDCLRSQIVTINEKRGKHLKYMPFAFTENGIAMLSSVLRSNTAIQVNIRIMRAFTKMRRFMLSNAQMFQRIDAVEKRQIMTDAKVDNILERLEASEPPLQGVFYDGQLWDACSLVERLIGRAESTILLIDSWVGVGTLDMFAKKHGGVAVELVTSPRGNSLAASDLERFNAQYPTLAVKTSTAFHDRFLIIDDKELYLIGASLKDLGRKCFGFTRMDSGEIDGIKSRP